MKSGRALALVCVLFALQFAAPALGADTDNDGLDDLVDPCISDARNQCAGQVAVDNTTLTEVRLNANVSAEACSGVKVDCNGDTWAADFGYSSAASPNACDLAGGCPVDATALFGCTGSATGDLFRCEHWDDAALPELSYSFDVFDGDYVVNLYFMNSYSGTTMVGDRTFDITIEGVLEYDDFDQVAAAGGSGIPVVRSALVSVSDGNGLQIEFGHEVQNPAVKAIEVLFQGECVVDGHCDDAESCTTDVCNAGVCENTALSNGVSCDDGIACTTGETCQTGVCGPGTPDDLLCDDSNECTDDTCNVVSGCVATNNTDPCDDGASCTSGDVCSAGACTGTNNCGVGENCDVGGGVCVAIPDVRINVNGVAHTGTDYPGSWAADPGVGGVCGTGAYTSPAPDIHNTVDDVLFSGEVWGTPVLCSVDDGGTPLAAGEYHVSLLFAELYFGAGCPGGGVGTGERVFDVMLEGVTVETGVDLFAEGGCPASTTVSTGTPVVKDYVVNINDGVLDIALPAISNNAKISAIEIVATECFVNTDCDDANACTNDVCTDGMCSNDDISAACDDGEFCNGVEGCSAGSGCTAGTPVNVDDGVDCTDDSCDEVLNVVVNTANDLNCDDFHACTADSCDEILGCAHVPIPGCFVPIVPSLSFWGMGVMALQFAAAGAWMIRRRGSFEG